MMIECKKKKKNGMDEPKTKYFHISIFFQFPFFLLFYPTLQCHSDFFIRLCNELFAFYCYALHFIQLGNVRAPLP